MLINEHNGAVASNLLNKSNKSKKSVELMDSLSNLLDN